MPRKRATITGKDSTGFGAELGMKAPKLNLKEVPEPAQGPDQDPGGLKDSASGEASAPPRKRRSPARPETLRKNEGEGWARIHAHLSVPEDLVAELEATSEKSGVPEAQILKLAVGLLKESLKTHSNAAPKGLTRERAKTRHSARGYITVPDSFITDYRRQFDRLNQAPLSTIARDYVGDLWVKAVVAALREAREAGA